MPAEAVTVARHYEGTKALVDVLRGTVLAVDEMLTAPKESEVTENKLRLRAVGSGS